MLCAAGAQPGLSSCYVVVDVWRVLVALDVLPLDEVLDALLDHLEVYCTDRTAAGATKEDMLRGNVWTHEGTHHFIFREFFNSHLLKRRWAEKYDETQMLLRDKCGCKIKRETIGKKNKTIMTIEKFEKAENVYRPKQFKPKEVF